MKRFIVLFSMCIVLFVVDVPNLQAQKAKAAKKAIELITKGAKKAPKKTPGVKPKTPSKQITPRPHPTTVTATCSQCNGHGVVTSWNSYYGQYQTVTCSNCNGSGKIKKTNSINL